MRNWLKTVLFISTFSPCLISISVARAWEVGRITWDSTLYFALGIAGVLVIRAIITAIHENGETFPFSAKKIESNDAMMMTVLVSYFIPFIGKASDITFVTIIILLILLWAVMWISTSIPPHPVLRLLNYRFYKIESAKGVVYTLITRREISDPAQVKNVKKISSSMLVEVL
jgi:hypothetical protein